MTIEGRPARQPSDELDVHYNNVSPGYFKALGADIVDGRGLTETDRDSLNMVGVINETLARHGVRWLEPDRPADEVGRDRFGMAVDHHRGRRA